MLANLVASLKQSLGVQFKQDIQQASSKLGSRIKCQHQEILIGDDCAAIPDQQGYLLLAAEGILPNFVQRDPWFAGWCALMVNISDVLAMGGDPIAVVDVLWSQDRGLSDQLWAGMQAAALAYGIPIVGGHTSGHSEYTALAVAILGRATHLISSFAAQPGDTLLMAIDMQGSLFKDYPFWNAATHKDPQVLRQGLKILPDLAQSGLCRAGKDISMGGLVGTALMLLETSGVGAILDVGSVPCPEGIPLSMWLRCFPSFGFLLSVDPDHVSRIQARFAQDGILCQPVGRVTQDPKLWLKMGSEVLEFWDLSRDPLTGFGKG